MARNDHNYSNIKLLVVDDDASIDNPSHSTGRRGLAGSLIINKIAGAMSEQEYSLEEIYDYCENILSERAVQTIGFSFHHNNSNELVDIEIGYGIHGEPGSIKIEKEKNFKPIIGILKKKLRLSDVKSEVVILFNNLGGTSEFSFYHFVHEFIENVKELPIKIVKVYAGKFLTSLSKEALSVTILEVKNPKTFELLEFEVEIPCKHLFNMPLSLNVPTLKNFEIPKILRHQSPEAQAPSKEIEIARKMIEKACKAAVGMRKCLNEIDGELGDGDTGSTVERGAKALLKHDELEFNNPHNMLQQISEILMKAMGGTSGAIFSIFFQCASKAFAEDNRYSLDNWITGISMGFDGIMLLGKGNIGDRTLLDALYFGLMRMKENSRKSTKEGESNKSSFSDTFESRGKEC